MRSGETSGTGRNWVETIVDEKLDSGITYTLFIKDGDSLVRDWRPVYLISARLSPYF